MLMLRHRTCSDRGYFGLDFISYAELLLLNIDAAGKFLMDALMVAERSPINRVVTRVTRPP